MTIEPNGPSGARGAVLVVDDDRDMRALLREFLQDEGYSVREARDGQVAMDLLRQTTACWVVLTDHLMPQLDGPGLMAAVLADPRLRARHAFIYMTAADGAIEPDLERLLALLHATVLRKPFPLEVCAATVAAAAERLAGVKT